MIESGSGRFVFFLIFAAMFIYIGLTLQALDEVKSQLYSLLEQRKITQEEYDQRVNQIDFMSVALDPKFVLNLD
ncbi:MAG TPA: hypothetical protein VLJ10_02100 [Candidatus Bathyarchaeia archaeon]|nr:hypothetical protein [Candidatus Bathyarchaeia archaeon]